MWLLIVSIIVFLIVIGLIAYANWPRSLGSNGCAGDDCPGCGSCQGPCNRCHKPKNRCGCPKPPGGGCSFC